MRILIPLLLLLSSCSTDTINPQEEQIEAIHIDYVHGKPVISMLCEGYGWLNYRVTVFHNRDIVTPFCASKDSIYRHTLKEWSPGDTVWVDKWPCNMLPDQTIIL